jgi:uncharacterized membrane protein
VFDQPPSPSISDMSHQEQLIRQTELIISNVLRGGVLLSAAVISVGSFLFYIHYFSVAGHTVDTAVFPHSLASVARGLVQGDPVAIIVLGLLLLLATPVVRVAVSIVAFGLERDWRYVVISTIVLLILLISFVLGKGGA